MIPQRREFDRSLLIKAIAVLVGVCLSLITSMGGLITYIYFNYSETTSENVATISKNVDKLVRHRIKSDEQFDNYVHVTNTKLSYLEKELRKVSVVVNKNRDNLKKDCFQTKYYMQWEKLDCEKY